MKHVVDCVVCPDPGLLEFHIGHGERSEVTSTARALVAMLLGSLLCVISATFTISAVAQSYPRDGWCEEGEGQTIVVDFGNGTVVVRCISVDGGYPTNNYPWSPYIDALDAAGFDTTVDGFLIAIDGVFGDGLDGRPSWQMSTGTVNSGEGSWNDVGQWSADPEIDTFVGAALGTAWKPPVPAPQFGPPQQEEPGDDDDSGAPPGEDPGDDPGEDPGDDPGEDPGDDPGEGEETPTPDPEPSEPATPAPGDDAPTADTSPTPAPQPRSTRSPAPSPRSTPSRTRAPTPPRTVSPSPSPSVTETPEPTETPIPVEESDGEGGESEPAQVEATQIWGREGTERRESEGLLTPEAPTWAPIMALAAGIIFFGGLGGAFTLGLRQAASNQPVEEE